MPDWYNRLLKQDFSSFIAKTLATTDPGACYIPNWHIDLIAQHLEAARMGEINRLIINLPPRSLKSTCVSVAWPAWLLGHNPQSRIMAASYASSLSIKHSLDSKLVVESEWYRRLFPEMAIAHGENEKHKFVTTQRGFRMATSVGGSTTGEGGNFLIIDDPLSPAQAMNKLWRDYTNRWFDHTFASRLDDKKRGVIVLVMQRLHAQDLTGYLLAKGGWQHLSLPAVAERREQYIIGGRIKIRAPGGLLHDEREDAELIERAKIELGSSAFSAQYQQRPLDESSSMVKAAWLGRYDAPPVMMERYVQSWDTAIKCESHHDASVCLTLGEWQGKSYLLDVRSYRAEYPDVKRAVYELAVQWKPAAILIEDKSSGQQLLQDARRETSLPIIAMKPKSSKITRFAAITAMIEAGRLVLPRQAAWLADFENELFGFPNSPHDDQVDALTQYLDWLRNAGWNKLRVRNL